MSKVLLVYASMSGNTEAIADLVEAGLKDEGVTVDCKEVVDADASSMTDYDGVILGAYTWGEGELPDEFLDFYDDMAGTDLSGKKCAVFGSGSTAYDVFCGAVDLLESMIEEKGGSLVLEGMKVEEYPEDEDACTKFGADFAKAVNG